MKKFAPTSTSRTEVVEAFAVRSVALRFLGFRLVGENPVDFVDVSDRWISERSCETPGGAVGGYFVRDEDGDENWWSAGDFETRYVEVAPEPEPRKPVIPQPTPTMRPFPNWPFVAIFLLSVWMAINALTTATNAGWLR